MKQEELPLDPDEIGGPDQEIKTTATIPTSSASQKSTPSLDDYQSQPTVSENQTIEPMDTSVGGETTIDLTLRTKVSVSSLSNQDQSIMISCDTKVSSDVKVSKSTQVQPVIDLTTKKSEPDGCEDQFDDFMDDLNDEDFCTSFANFDDDNDDGEECDPTNYDDKDKEYVPSDIEEDDESEDGESGSSDNEEWKSEGVDYVKTVAEMAEEAEMSDLFDPKVLGKQSCMINEYC